MRLLSLLSALTLAVSGAAILAMNAQNSQAQDSAEITPVASDVMSDKPLIVAELFTSQSCSSCPPAEDLFSQLAERDDVLTLEWHVDYWDDLVHGGSRWKDPYSNPDYTARQRAYNRSLRGTGAVYTPQAVVNGHFEGVGSRKHEVNDLVENAPSLTVPVSIKADRVHVAATDASADVVFVTLLKSHQTNVKGGENKGRKLHGKNIVLDTTILGETGTAPTDFKLPRVGDNETCAVFVQNLTGELEPVLGAAKCV